MTRACLREGVPRGPRRGSLTWAATGDEVWGETGMRGRWALVALLAFATLQKYGGGRRRERKKERRGGKTSDEGGMSRETNEKQKLWPVSGILRLSST